MNRSRQILIGDLVGDLTPVRHAGQTWRLWLAWLAIASLYSTAIVLITGTVRGNALTALRDVPAYALEILAATVAIALLSHTALRTAIPHGRSWPPRVALPALALGAWIGLVVWGLIGEPALPATIQDQRPHCFSQALIFSVPSLGLMLWLARGLLPLAPRVTAALAGAAAAALPAVLMQIACKYEPVHALAYHLSAIPLVAALGALIGPRILARRAVVPRRRGEAVH
jgi:hypothetical protein